MAGRGGFVAAAGIVLAAAGVVVAVLTWRFPVAPDTDVQVGQTQAPTHQLTATNPAPVPPTSVARPVSPPVITPAPRTAKPKATYEVPVGFVGTWLGSVEQAGSESYGVIVTISGGRVGESLAAVEYPELQCQGIWRLDSGTSTSIRVTELINPGASGCIDRVVITLVLDGQRLRYSIDDPTTVRGILQRG